LVESEENYTKLESFYNKKIKDLNTFIDDLKISVQELVRNEIEKNANEIKNMQNSLDNKIKTVTNIDALRNDVVKNERNIAVISGNIQNNDNVLDQRIKTVTNVDALRNNVVKNERDITTLNQETVNIRTLVTPVYISLFASGNPTGGEQVNWTQSCVSSNNHFTLNPAHTINILQTGVYFISVKLAMKEYNGNFYYDIRRNGSVISQIYTGAGHSNYFYWYTSPGTSEIHQLQANDRIQVQVCSGNNQYSCANNTHSNLSIFKL